ncbi:exosome complex component RRP4 isoform X2 [Schistocerca gregaria]|uniref:exosome complex component RRP4 isoform X2 n=1 Tax=Schistocerca gregaria TaxID=7010 RepID=UPI00211DA730|nr:exosome complex component RRP4 isoform X2 [Schistocerca gregaria]
MMSALAHIRLASERVDSTIRSYERSVPRILTPGEIITSQSGCMRGHGTYAEDDNLKASVAGVEERIIKLVSVRPLKSRYVGEIGDVVVGRITEVQQKRWKVDTNARLDSILLLSSVNLPGGELRRRSAEDEQKMRKYLQEGDLISAEVLQVYSDGSLSLYTRSLKYGKLSQGVLVKVFPSLVKRRKTHFHNLTCGASIILGNNGFIWLCPTASADEEGGGGFTQNLEEKVDRADREVIARLRNCILALANSKMMLYDTSIQYAFDESMKYKVAELLQPEPMKDVAVLTRHRLTLSV